MESPLIAIVDDDLDFLDLLDELLGDEGFRTLRQTTSTGAQATLRAARPALVILDLWLEYPDAGWHVLRELRHDPLTAATPVLVCTASAARATRRTPPVPWSPDALLPKPFDLDDLLAQIHRLGARAQTVRAAGNSGRGRNPGDARASG